MNNSRVLIVEDEVKLATLLADYFVNNGATVTLKHDGNEVIGWLQENQVDAILLDIMLPGKDGMTLLKELRTFSDTPVLMVTARVDEIDRLIGLESGADDYICKPFSPREVVARVNAILRRIARVETGESSWKLDAHRYEFAIGDRAVPLTAAEFNLLARLCSEPGRIYSRGHLMTVMYDDGRIVSERTIDSHVKKLRAKLALVWPEQPLIESVYGVGYRFIG